MAVIRSAFPLKKMEIFSTCTPSNGAGKEKRKEQDPYRNRTDILLNDQMQNHN